MSVRGGTVVIDECARCGGVFLDRDELLHLTADHALNNRLVVVDAMDEPSLRACPNCGTRMSMEEARGVEVEACPKCHGLWLDADELEALAMRPMKS